MANKISTVLDLDSKGFGSSLKSIRTDIAAADGVGGKFKAGISSIGSELKANMGPALIAGGAAVAAFGIKAVGAFQDTAIEMGKFSDATGTSVEDASRLTEVADDLGISQTSLQGALQRFNKTVADGKAPLADWGVEIVRAKDGTVDAYQSFINAATAIGAIKDPTERAKAAQQAFGKSYGEIAEMMKMSAEGLRKKLGEVSDARIIDQGELDQAKKYREALDKIQDALRDFQLEVGQALTPALTDAANMISGLSDLANKVTGSTGGLGKLFEWSKVITEAGIKPLIDGFKALKNAIDPSVDGVLDDSVKAYIEQTRAIADAQQATDDYTSTTMYADRIVRDFTNGTGAEYKKTLDEAAKATKAADAALQTLKGHLDEKQAWINAQQAVDDMRAKIADGGSSWRDLQTATIDAASSVADFVATTTTIPDEVKTNIYTALDQGNLDGVLTFLDAIAKGIDLPIYPRVVGSSTGIGASVAGKRAAGGPVTGGLPYLVGENGPEVVVPSGSGNVIPNNRLGSGAGNITVIVQGADERAVIDRLNRWQARGGRV